MTTPDGTRVVAHRADGTEIDVTEGVQALYDLAVGSMDFGSGFWTVDDAVPVRDLANACGFDGKEAAEQYLAEQREKEDRQAFHQELAQKRGVNPWSLYNEPHVHRWSELGNCLWPMCRSRQENAERPVVP